MVLTLALVLLAATLPQTLEVGKPVTEKFTDDDPEISTPQLEKKGSARARTYRMSVESSGWHHITLKSNVTDCYLILRDENANILAEDDDGLYFRHAMIEYELVAGREYRVDAVQTVVPWKYELSLSKGLAPKYSLRQRVELGVADSEAMVADVAREEGDPSKSLAVTLGWHGTFLNRIGRLDQAVDAYRRRAKVMRALVGTHDHTAVCEFHLGEALYRAGRFAEVAAPMRACREFFEAAKKPSSPWYFDSYISRASQFERLTLARTGQSQQARAAFEEAVTQLEEQHGPSSHEVFGALTELVALYRATRDHSAASRTIDRVCAIANGVDPEDPKAAHVLGEAAEILRTDGRFGQAEPYARQAIEVATRRGDSAQLAPLSSRLGSVLLELGELKEARTLFETSLALYEQHHAPDHPEAGVAHSNLGSLHRYLDNLPRSERHLRTAYSILRKTLGTHHRQTWRVLDVLVLVLIEQKQFQAARQLVNESLRQRIDKFGKNDLDVALARGLLAWVHREAGEFAQAIELQRRVLETRLALLPPEHLRIADARFRCAETLIEMGEYEGAGADLAGALTIRERRLGRTHPHFSQTLEAASLRSEGVGDLDRAWSRAREACQSRRDYLVHSQHSLTEAEALRAIADLRGSVDRVIDLARRRPEGDSLLTAYRWVLETKGRVSRIALENRARLRRERTPQVLAQLDELRTVQDELAHILFEGSGAERQRIRELEERRNHLLVQLSANDDAPSGPTANPWEAIRQALPRNSVLIDFSIHRRFIPPQVVDGAENRAGRWESAPNLSAWISTPSRERPQLISLGNCEDIARAVTEYRNAMFEDSVSRGTRIRPKRSDEPPARSQLALKAEQLRTKLWTPLADPIGAAEIVFVAPDGFLGSLPLGTLLDADDRFLIERHAFVYVDSAAQIPNCAPDGSHSNPTLLAIGGVDYGPPTTSSTEAARGDDRGAYRRDWQSLPGTEAESQAIANLHEGQFGDAVARSILHGKEATETRLSDELSRYGVLHLSTHGAFNAVQLGDTVRDDVLGSTPGLRSGLVLAGANQRGQTGDDGVLTAEEVSWLPMGQCELVVLSACETGVGVAHGGEGMASLRRAFHLAGARTVISSLWQVPDRATQELMEEFYRNLWTKDLSALDALRRAQLRQLERNRADRGHGLPWSWGAFVLSGGWR